MKRIIATLLIAGSMLTLNACATAAPVTPKTAQAAISKTFTTLNATIEKNAVIKIKNHQGKAYVPSNCAEGKVALSDTSAVYVTKDFNLPAYLKSLQNKVNAQGYQTSLGTDTGHATLLMSKADYDYTAIALDSIKVKNVDTNKAVLFTVTSPCFVK